MNKNIIELNKYTDDEIRTILQKYKKKKDAHNKYMSNYYHKQKKKADNGDEKAKEFIERKREKARESYKRLNDKENITEERKLRNKSVMLYQYWKKKNDIKTFINKHPDKVEFLKNNNVRKPAHVKYPELFQNEVEEQETN